MTRVQDYPAEGSREVIDRELARLDRAQRTDRDVNAVDAGDVVRLLGELDAARIAEILALSPSLADLEQAAAWLQGDGDALAQAGQPLIGKAAQVFDIAESAEESALH